MRRKFDSRWFWMLLVLTSAAFLAACSGGRQAAVEAASATAVPGDSGTAPGNPAVSPNESETFGGLVGALHDMISEPTLTVPEGTVLRARLIPTLSTQTHEVGDSFEATLVESLVMDGHVVAPAGAGLTGTVVEADKGGRVEGRARIAVQLTEMETARGQRVEISTDSAATTARATKTKDAQKIGIGAGVGAAIGAIAGGGKGAAIGAAAGGGAGTGAVLATRGAPAVLESETVLNFTLRHAVTIP